MWEDEVPKDLKPLNIHFPPPSEEATHIADTIVFEGIDGGVACLNFQVGQETISYSYETFEEAEADGNKIRKTITIDLDQFGHDSMVKEQERVITYLNDRATEFRARLDDEADEVAIFIEGMIRDLFPNVG